MSVLSFEFIFMYGMRKDILLHVRYSFVPTRFVEKTIFLLLNGLGTHVENQLIWYVLLDYSQENLVYINAFFKKN